VNSASFGWIVFYAMYFQIYIFWLFKCKSNLEAAIFGVAYITQMYVVNFFENIWTCSLY
jgi:hypothetical protein